MRKLLIFLAISTAVLGGAFFYLSQQASYSIIHTISDIRHENEKTHIIEENFSKSVANEVWAIIQQDSKLLKKSETVDEAFRFYMERMVSSYIDSFFKNESKILNLKNLSGSKYTLLQLKALYFIITSPAKEIGPNYKAIEVKDLQVMKYVVNFDLVFKKDQVWQIYAIENLRL